MQTTATIRIILLTTTALFVVACGSSGRDLREPATGQTAPARKEAAAGTVSTTVVEELSVFGLGSVAWVPGGAIPSRHTCDGENVSPPFAIFVPPTNAAELALVVTDIDNDFVHWIVVGIPTQAGSFAAGELPPGAVEATNDSGREAWSGPCPPEGEQHTYEFALYALERPSGAAPGQPTESVVAAISSDPVELATLTGTYER